MIRIRVFRMFAMALLAVTALCTAKSAHAQFPVLYNFGTGSDNPPENPSGAIAQGLDGSLYGTTVGGGQFGEGTVFKITPGGSFRVLHSFCSLPICADGQSPNGLTLRPDGHFIGTTSAGGAHDIGIIFDISQTGSFTLLYSFTGGTDGGAPQAPPILGPDGAFYGTSATGGAPSSCGTLYRLGAKFSVLHGFNRVNGCEPVTSLVLGTDGNFYGTTVAGGVAGEGVIFQATYRPGKATLFTVLNSLDGTTLAAPTGSLVEGNDGNFYGTTSRAGIGNAGAVFKITPSGSVTVLHSLNGTTDGFSPLTGLIQGSDGNFYGTALEGGNTDENCAPAGCGTLFQVTPSGAFSVPFTFRFTNGSSPSAIFQHTNSFLYVETTEGGLGPGGVFDSFAFGGSYPGFANAVQSMGAVGSAVEILGQDFTSVSTFTTTVSFNGVPATVTLQSPTSLRATVPAGATTGFITVTTFDGVLTTNKQFVVTP